MKGEAFALHVDDFSDDHCLHFNSYFYTLLLNCFSELFVK